MDFDGYNALDFLEKRKNDIEKYIHAIDNVENCLERDYQRNFNSFFGVRRNEDWQKTYYDILKCGIDRTPTFEYVIKKLLSKGMVESSYSSKLIAILDPNMPIWDKYVLRYFGLKLTGRDRKQRLENAVVLYNSLIEKYKEFIPSKKGKDWIEQFDKKFANYADKLTPTKKIDFIIWSMRETKPCSKIKKVI